MARCMLNCIKYCLLMVTLFLGIIESPLCLNFYGTSWKNDVIPQDEQLDSRLIGVWVMVLKVVDGEIENDVSIEKKYAYNFQKNGNYIIDLRAFRDNMSFNEMSIVDLPHFKWRTYDGVIEMTASVNGVQAPFSDRYAYYFKGDTLVRSISKSQFYYVRKTN